MFFPISPLVQTVEAPPIAEAMSWVEEKPGNRPLINLSQAVPSYPPSSALQEHLVERVRHPETSLYTDIAGLPELRRELADAMARDYGGDTSFRDVMISSGCNQAFCLALLALARAGDNVILPAPFYFNHQMWLSMLGIEARNVGSMSQAGAVPSVADAASLIDERSRAIVLVTPNNPTGSVYPSSTVSEYFELCRSRKIALVVDETYKDFRENPAPPHDLFQRPDWRNVFIQLYSFSKAYALTGYRVGSIIAGPPFIAEIEKIMDCVSISAPRISQYAALFGLRSLSAWKNDKTDLMANRLASLRSAFAQPSLRYELAVSGAYFAYVCHPFEGSGAKDVAKRLAKEHQLLCLPGTMFGPGQERYLRLAFANVEAGMMGEVVDRLIESQ